MLDRSGNPAGMPPAASGLRAFGGVGPLPFFFPAAHFWAAWLTIGALLVHVGAKLTTTRRTVFAPPTAVAVEEGDLSRRGFLATVVAATGAVVLGVVGETLRPLNRLAVLAPRRPTVGPPQGAHSREIVRLHRRHELRERLLWRLRRDLARMTSARKGAQRDEHGQSWSHERSLECKRSEPKVRPHAALRQH